MHNKMGETAYNALVAACRVGCIEVVAAVLQTSGVELE